MKCRIRALTSSTTEFQGDPRSRPDETQSLGGSDRPAWRSCGSVLACSLVSVLLAHWHVATRHAHAPHTCLGIDRDTLIGVAGGTSLPTGLAGIVLAQSRPASNWYRHAGRALQSSASGQSMPGSNLFRILRSQHSLEKSSSILSVPLTAVAPIPLSPASSYRRFR